MEVAKPSATMKKRKPVPRTPAPMNAEEKYAAILDLAGRELKKLRQNPNPKLSDLQRLGTLWCAAQQAGDAARTMPKAVAVRPLPLANLKTEPFT